MGLQSQSRFLCGPSTQPLQVLRASKVQYKTESHLRNCAILTCLLANSCGIIGGQDTQHTTGDGWINANCTSTNILKSNNYNRRTLSTL
jgi:hypothetical protein